MKTSRTLTPLPAFSCSVCQLLCPHRPCPKNHLELPPVFTLAPYPELFYPDTFSVCPSGQRYFLGKEKSRKCCFIHSPVSKERCITHGMFSLLRRAVLERGQAGRLQGGGNYSCGRCIQTQPGSKMQLCFLQVPQPNFLRISDHLLFPIMLLFTLSIWRLQMLNDKGEGKGGGEEFHFA